MIDGRKRDTMRMRAILVVAAAVAFASAPFWSGGFGGFDLDAFPRRPDTPPVSPAGYAFSIWSVIYLWLIASALYGQLRRADHAAWDRTRWPLIASLVIGTPWISVAVKSPEWATVMIWAMLLTALLALFRAPHEDRWWLRAPLALYAGWLTAAACVSVGIVLWGYGAPAVSLAVLPVAAAIGILVQRALSGAPLYGVAIAWALVGVAVQSFGVERPALAVLALALAAAIAGFAALSERRGRAV
jgi:hypothetical protein